MGKGTEFRGIRFRGGGISKKKYANITNAIPKLIYVASFIQIEQCGDGEQAKFENAKFEISNLEFKLRNFDTRFEISFVGTMDISSYTQYGQPR